MCFTFHLAFTEEYWRVFWLSIMMLISVLFISVKFSISICAIKAEESLI